MPANYRAAFLVPLDSKKVLGSAGWEIFSNGKLPFSAVTIFLEDTLGLKLVEKYSGMMSYVGPCLKATVMFDSDQQPQQVYFQVYCDDERLKAAFTGSSLTHEAELFVPSDRGK